MDATPKEVHITVSAKATINTGAYENVQPLYSVTEIYERPDMNCETSQLKRIKELKEMLTAELQLEYSRVKGRREKPKVPGYRQIVKEAEEETGPSFNDHLDTIKRDDENN